MVENEIAEKKNNMMLEQEENDNKEEIGDNDKVNKIQKEMSEHFKAEIDLRKKIIDEEEQIEKLKNDINSIDYEIIHKPRINVEYLTDEYENKKKEIKK